MKIRHGVGATKYGPGVEIILNGDEVAIAIDAYLVARRIYVQGARTITIGGELLTFTKVYFDPSGRVINHKTGQEFLGRG